MKKLVSLILAIMMIAVVGLAFATSADMNGEQGRIGEFTTPDTPIVQTDTVIIKKEITAYNPESVIVNAPTITYKYTIAAATVSAGTSVTDHASRHNKIDGKDVTVRVAVKAGVGTPTITGTAAGTLAITTADHLSASQYGTANRFDLTVSFDGIFKTGTAVNYGAGVYRYVINETTNATSKNAAGIAEGTTPKELFLDVYVNGSGEIYGYVLFTNNTTIDGSAGEDTAATAAGKVEGFVDDPANTVYSSENISNADKYYTFNFELKKVVTGDNYSISTKHKFPFHVTLDNPTVTADVLPIMTVGNDAEQTALSAGAIGTDTSATVWEPKIAHNATVKYVGIPCGTTVTIYETNDVIGVTYKSSSTQADTNAAEKSINHNVNSNNAIINCNATALKAAIENHTSTASSKDIIFTNDLQEISPTGYVSRFAPYALILIAGIVLLIVAKKRKPAEEE